MLENFNWEKSMKQYILFTYFLRGPQIGYNLFENTSPWQGLNIDKLYIQ